MKYFLTTITFILLLTNCSYKNAYTQFDMSTEEEKITTNTQSSKITNSDSVIGVFNAVYINNTDKIYFDKEEHFLISIYAKDKNAKFSYKLNTKSPLKVQELTNIKQYTTYIKHPKKWERHYIVTFKKSEKNLKLILESSGYDSKVLHFQKY